MKNKKLISYSGIVDAATGEQISSSQRELKLPRTVSFPKHFTKIHDRSRDKLNPKDLWKFIQLTYYLDYDTNKLVNLFQLRIFSHSKPSIEFLRIIILTLTPSDVDNRRQNNRTTNNCINIWLITKHQVTSYTSPK